MRMRGADKIREMQGVRAHRFSEESFSNLNEPLENHAPQFLQTVSFAGAFSPQIGQTLNLTVLVGFAPEYGDIGSQTADLVRRHLQGQPLRPSEAPRTVRTLVNERVARVLGLRPVSGKEVEFVQ